MGFVTIYNKGKYEKTIKNVYLRTKKKDVRYIRIGIWGEKKWSKIVYR